MVKSVARGLVSRRGGGGARRVEGDHHDHDEDCVQLDLPYPEAGLSQRFLNTSAGRRRRADLREGTCPLSCSAACPCPPQLSLRCLAPHVLPRTKHSSDEPPGCVHQEWVFESIPPYTSIWCQMDPTVIPDVRGRIRVRSNRGCSSAD